MLTVRDFSGAVENSRITTETPPHPDAIFTNRENLEKYLSDKNGRETLFVSENSVSYVRRTGIIRTAVLYLVSYVYTAVSELVTREDNRPPRPAAGK